jgi:hypothetical protein
MIIVWESLSGRPREGGLHTHLNEYVIDMILDYSIILSPFFLLFPLLISLFKPPFHARI